VLEKQFNPDVSQELPAPDWVLIASKLEQVRTIKMPEFFKQMEFARFQQKTVFI